MKKSLESTRKHTRNTLYPNCPNCLRCVPWYWKNVFPLDFLYLYAFFEVAYRKIGRKSDLVSSSLGAFFGGNARGSWPRAVADVQTHGEGRRWVESRSLGWVLLFSKGPWEHDLFLCWLCWYCQNSHLFSCGWKQLTGLVKLLLLRILDSTSVACGC